MVWEPFCGTARNPLLSSNNFTQGHLMKMKLLVTNVTAIGSPGRAERAVFGGDFGWACFWPIQDIFVDAEPLCDVGTSS